MISVTATHIQQVSRRSLFAASVGDHLPSTRSDYCKSGDSYQSMNSNLEAIRLGTDKY